MKKLIILFLTLTSLLAYDGRVTLVWNYPEEELSPNLSFIVYHTTNITLPLESWPVLTNVIGTQRSVDLTITPGKNFFVMKASNFWGESSPFSNIASTPDIPRGENINLFILKR